MVWMTIIGYSWDSFLVHLSVIEYVYSDLNSFAPLWIAAMWAMFATTLNASLTWLQERYLLSAILGAIFGPIAYYSAFQLGAINAFQWPDAMLLQAIAWALFMPSFILLNKIIYQTQLSAILEQK